MDPSEIVERLRAYAQIAHAAAAWGFAGEGFVMAQAADLIEREIIQNKGKTDESDIQTALR